MLDEIDVEGVTQIGWDQLGKLSLQLLVIEAGEGQPQFAEGTDPAQTRPTCVSAGNT